MLKRSAFVTVAAALALGLSACGGDDEGDVAATDDTDTDFTVEIDSPAEDAEVGLPFTIELTTNAELGPPESGLHHAHVFFDGDMDNFEIVDAETWEIAADSPIAAGIETGERVLNVTLHTANHEPVGAQDEITIQLTDAGIPGSDDDSDPGY